MYSSTAIQTLIDRIGWDAPKQPTSKVLTAENLRSASGSLFSRFHQLAIVEVVEEVMPISNAVTATDGITNEVLNAQLYSLKEQAARKALGLAFDTNTAAAYSYASGQYADTYGNDWSPLIITRAPALDELYGLCLASLVLDMVINNQRSSGTQRRTFDSAQVKVESEGYTDASGGQVGKSISYKIAAALKAANLILFPASKSRTVIRDASYMW